MMTARLRGRPVRVESAGTHAISGNTVDKTISKLLQQLGHDAMPEHRSRPIMPAMLARYDLILCLENRHLDDALAMYPAGRGKVRLLGHWNKLQIADPYGQSETQYAQALEQIEACTAQWAQKLTDLEML